MSRPILLLPLLCLAGCAIPQPGMYGNSPYGGFGMKRAISAQQQAPAQEFVEELVEVRTEPPGARVHINDAFAGYAPLQFSVRRFWRGQPGYQALDTVKVEALPVAGGQCVQAGVFGQNNQKAPSPVSFVMTDCRPAPGQAPAGTSKQ